MMKFQIEIRLHAIERRAKEKGIDIKDSGKRIQGKKNLNMLDTNKEATEKHLRKLEQEIVLRKKQQDIKRELLRLYEKRETDRYANVTKT